jgi:lysine 2,3-aminomutase
MERWQKALNKSLICLEELAHHFHIDIEPLKPVVEHYPLRITRYYLSLIKYPGDPIWLQCIPDPRESEDNHLFVDPLNEGGLTPIPGLIHRYPDRVVLLVSSVCPTYCRFCLRKHRLGSQQALDMDEGLKYIERNRDIRDVILSGGDPFILSDELLKDILGKLRGISHVEMIRINTRAPVTLPERITLRLCRMLNHHHPLYVNTHFNHPSEITLESTGACARLADAGIPLGNQTVLLKGVNDDPEVMKKLMQKLLTIRVRPYYIHQMDLVQGTNHFRTSVGQGLKIMAGIRGHTSGMATPYYVIDLPGGKGKVPILPDDVTRKGETLFLRNYLGEVIEYQDGRE